MHGIIGLTLRGLLILGGHLTPLSYLCLQIFKAEVPNPIDCFDWGRFLRHIRFAYHGVLVGVRYVLQGLTEGCRE